MNGVPQLIWHADGRRCGVALALTAPTNRIERVEFMSQGWYQLYGTIGWRVALAANHSLQVPCACAQPISALRYVGCHSVG